MKKRRPIFRFTCLLLLAASSLSAEVQLGSLFTDHMVLQHGMPLKIWGKAKAGERVLLKVANQSEQTTANAEGRWEIQLKQLPPSHEPILFEVSSQAKSIQLKDVLVGDVWICGGQSNMHWELKKTHRADVDIPKAQHSSLRLLDVSGKSSFYKLDEIKAKWTPCTPKSAKNFSAAGYYFGRDLMQRYDLPIGLIRMTYSGTKTQAWSSLESLQAEPSLAHYAKIADYSEASITQLEKDYENVLKPQYEAALTQYEAEKKNSSGKRVRKPEKVRPPRKDPNLPAKLYNGLVHPLVGFPIKGLLWYQGGSNATSKETAIEYETLLTNLFTDWRQRWGQGDFPVIFVQHAAWRPARPGLPFLYEAQRRAHAKIANSMMVIALDLGERSNVHPSDKFSVAQRLVQAARNLAYGESMIPTGPLFRSHTTEGGKIRVHFDHAGKGLKIGKPPIQLKQTADPPQDRLNSFEIAGSDGLFVEAQARIDGQSVLVWCEQVPKPIHVRYAWSTWPEANLYNDADLPASPFCSRDYRSL